MRDLLRASLCTVLWSCSGRTRPVPAFLRSGGAPPGRLVASTRRIPLGPPPPATLVVICHVLVNLIRSGSRKGSTAAAFTSSRPTSFGGPLREAADPVRRGSDASASLASPRQTRLPPGASAGRARERLASAAQPECSCLVRLVLFAHGPVRSSRQIHHACESANVHAAVFVTRT